MAMRLANIAGHRRVVMHDAEGNKFCVPRRKRKQRTGLR